MAAFSVLLRAICIFGVNFLSVFASVFFFHLWLIFRICFCNYPEMLKSLQKAFFQTFLLVREVCNVEFQDSVLDIAQATPWRRQKVGRTKKDRTGLQEAAEV